MGLTAVLGVRMRLVAPVATALVLATGLAAGLALGLPGPAAGAKPTCDGRTATIVGTAGADRLTGTAKADVIVGLTGDDRIEGLGGDDVVCGGPGADHLLGGAGDDRLLGGLDRLDTNAAGKTLVGDVVEGGPGADELTGGWDDRSAASIQRPDTFSWAAAARGVVVDLSKDGTPGRGRATGEGSDTLVLSQRMAVVGSSYADVITGSARRDRLDGRGGDDTIDAGGGPDLVLPDGLGGQPGDDLVKAGDGDDVVSSLTGRDDLRGGAGRDHIEAFSDQPTEVAAGGDNDFVGQRLAPGSGAATHGGTGADLVLFYARHLVAPDSTSAFVVDLRDGTASADGPVPSSGTVEGFEVYRLADDVRWRFFGSPRPERVWAIGGGPLRASMGAGNDTVTGTSRNDRVDGGLGRDTADGRGGHDTCTSVEAGPC